MYGFDRTLLDPQDFVGSRNRLSPQSANWITQPQIPTGRSRFELEDKMGNLPPNSLPVRNRIAYVAIFLMLTISTVITYGVNGRLKQPQQVLNKTTALAIVSTAPGQNNSLVMTVKNVSSGKNITGVVFRNRDAQIEIDFISGIGDHTIAPGQTYSRVFLPNDKAAVEASDIAVVAVVLDDRSINGDTALGQRLLDRRKGKKEQLQLILPALKEAMDSQAVNRVALAIANIEKIPHPHESGAQGVRELVLGKIQDHSSSPSARGTQALKGIYEEYSSLLSKL
jgi:hypothetical protein